MFSAQTRTRRSSDTLDRVERAAPHHKGERPRVEAQLELFTQAAHGGEKIQQGRQGLDEDHARISASDGAFTPSMRLVSIRRF